MRSGTSVAANYRAAFHGKSRADFIAKLGTVEEEADECLFWLELIQGLSARRSLGYDEQGEKELIRLAGEARELLAITIASRKTARANAQKQT
jgi:four helix bundle protein